MKKVDLHIWIAVVLVMAFGFLPGTGNATGWDDYLGDSVIYAAGGGSKKVNFIFIIDRSRATLNRAAGVPYFPGHVYVGSRRPWDIYESDNKGDFNSRVTINPVAGEADYDAEAKLKNLTCGVSIVKETLLAYGTYSGTGAAVRPNIRLTGQGSTCQTAPKGATYALGNYLNYLEQPPPNDKVIGADGKDYFLVGTHLSDASTMPGTEDQENWSLYWAPAGTSGEGEVWVSGNNYTVTAEASRTQQEIMYNAVRAAISSRYNVANFGLATYGPANRGGQIFEPIRALTSADVSVTETDSDPVPPFFRKIPGSGHSTAISAYSAGPARSQAEALYDVGYYLTGGSAYTNIINTLTIDPDIVNDCSTHVIFITNGLSNVDNDPKLRGITLNADNSINYSTSPKPEIAILGADVSNEDVYGEGSHHLDDVAWYLNHTHGITTNFILAFQNWDQLVARAAQNGGGQFFNVFNEEQLRKAVEKLLVTILSEVDTSFVAPVVPANPENRTFSGSRLYLGFFLPQNDQPWAGNLKKFGIGNDGNVVDRYGRRATCPDYDAAGNLESVCVGLADGVFKPTAISYWNNCADGSTACADGARVDSGGIGEKMFNMATSERKIFTFLGPNSNLTDPANMFSKRAEIRDALQMEGASDAEKDKVIDFLYGYDSWDFDEDGITDEKRSWILGDILHSKPLVLGYSRFNYESEETCPSDDDWHPGTSLETSSSLNKSVIFVGANDGMLHAVRDCDGKPLWSFIPPEFLPKLPLLNVKEYPSHQYFVDGTPTAFILDQNKNGFIEVGDRVILIFGLRRGGGKDRLIPSVDGDPSTSRGAYYGLDVTNPVQPIYLGKIDSTSVPVGDLLPREMGETWSQPTIARIKVGNEIKMVAFVGAGYDNNEDLRFGNTQYFPSTTTVDTDTTLPTDDAYMDSSGNKKTRSGEGTQVNPKGRGIYAFEIASWQQSFFGSSFWSFNNFGKVLGGITRENNDTMRFSIPSDLTILDTNYDGFVDRIYAGDTGGNLWRFDVGDTNPANWAGRVIFQANLRPDQAGYNSSTKGRKIFYRPSIVVKDGYHALFFGTGDRAHPLNMAVSDRLYMVKDTGQTIPLRESDLYDVTAFPQGLTTDQTIQLESKAGWYIRLPVDGEKVLAPALVFSGVAYYTTYAPSTDDAILRSCTEGNLGTARLWSVRWRDGSAAFYRDDLVDGSENGGANADIRSLIIGEGIPSGLVPTINEDGSSGGFIGCGAGLCLPPPTNNRLVYPLYWKQL
jgi:type IV pilus assembly protein PilY1